MKHLILLRGINVSGHRIIKMADLRERLEKAGFGGVKTYIQSGNVVLESALSKDALRDKISKSLEKWYGFEVGVFVMGKADLEKVVAQSPFDPIPEEGTKKQYVMFLSTKPDASVVKAWNEIDLSPETAVFGPEVIYLKYSDSAANTKLDNKFIESKLKVSATTRNWNTTLLLASWIDVKP